MNFFEEAILPKAWNHAGNGVVGSILKQEITDYHLYAKNPDTGENFRRFYRHLEPLHYSLSRNSAKELLNGQGDPGHLIQERISAYAKDVNLELFFGKCRKIAVLKGTIDLAHGEVLKTQLRNLSIEERASVGVVFLDYSSSKTFPAYKGLLNDLNCLYLGNIKNLKDRYMLLAYGIASASGVVHSKEIVWWGIPFGMIFVFNLSKLISFGRDDFAQRGDVPNGHTFIRSLLTVKHHFSFSSKYVDKIYTSTPLVHGFEEIDCPKLVQFKPSFYGENGLKGSSSLLTRKELEIIGRLNELKDSGGLLISSASRVDKTSNERYLSVVKTILDCASQSCIICFGKEFPAEYQDLMSRYGKNRVVFVGWLSPNATVRIIGLLDLFLDSFPFGAGMTFVSAAYQKIPIISTSKYVTGSPSSISILFYYYKTGLVNIVSERVVDNLFGTLSSIVDRVITCLKSPDHEGSKELRCIVSEIFIKSSVSVLSPRFL